MYTGDQRIDYSKLVDQQQHRLTDPFNRLNKAVNNITSTTKAAPAPRTAAAARVEQHNGISLTEVDRERGKGRQSQTNHPTGRIRLLRGH